MVEYVGFDVSKEETAFCVKDKDGKVLARGKVATDPPPGGESHAAKKPLSTLLPTGFGEEPTLTLCH